MESYRVPWCFDDESTKVLSFFTKLKCSLMPYLFSQAVLVREEGVPMMRAMMLEFPDDPVCKTLDRQYMLGESLLVAPVFNEDGQVEFYVPDCGVWIDYLSNEHFEGGRWYRRQYDYFGLPLLVKPGSVIATYAKKPLFKIYEFPEGGQSECLIYDDQCNKKLSALVSRTGNILEVSCHSGESWAVQLPGLSSKCLISGVTANEDQMGTTFIFEPGIKNTKIEIQE